MIWARRQYSEVQHVGIADPRGLATMCNTLPINEDNRPLWDYNRDAGWDDLRPCARCIVQLVVSGTPASNRALARWARQTLDREPQLALA